jgi:Heterokaryon incompatibility protein (HET)
MSLNARGWVTFTLPRRGWSTSSPPPEPLCEYCSKIPLENPRRSLHNWSLGPGERVKRSNCPLCQLVVRATRREFETKSENSTTPLSQVHTVLLFWRDGGGPAGRCAFSTSLAGRDIWICMAARAPDEASTSRIRILKPSIAAEFDVGRLSAWISTCAQTHGEKCSAESSDFARSFPGLGVVRFIDVEERSIVELRTVPRYVALSYVWGNVPTVKLTTGNRSSLMLPGGLQKAWHKVPLTIMSAVELVRRLDARYLWVDTLCLVQNDPADLLCGINVMDEIYERSWLTIIAADGHNANAGLPGIYEQTRAGRVATRVTKDISMGVYVTLDRMLESSVYASRAWT